MVTLAASFSVVILITLQYFTLWLLVKYHFKTFKRESVFPSVAIFVPCRNEAENLNRCLASLARLDYPAEKLQVILCDDDSTDATGQLIRAWTSTRENWFEVKIEQPKTVGINGKANALDQMIQSTAMDLFLFTDADCEVPITWVREMVGAYQGKFGLLTGITTVESESFFGVMQGLDWWLTLGKVKVVADLGFSLTAMGNNMLVNRELYTVAGGFKNTQHHVTEDLALSKAVFNRGYRPAHQVSKACLVKTLPAAKFSDLLRQRKRWMKGAFLLPWYWKFILGLQVAFYGGIVLVLYNYPYLGIALWAIKCLSQSMFLREFASKVETKIRLFELLSFEIYNWVVSWSTVIYYFWPSAIQWKNRNYS